jgi:mycobactin phenyloxazoline synthetase
MVPRQLIGLSEIPLTSNGKVDQGRLAELATNVGSQAAAPRSHQERLVAEVWSELLGRRIEDRRLSFFEAGGQSLLAVRLQHVIERRCGVRVSFADLLRVPTVEGMAALLGAGASTRAHSAIFRMQSGAAHAPVMVCIHPVGGTTFCYRRLLTQLGTQPTVVGLQSLGVPREITEVSQLAELYVAQLS